MEDSITPNTDSPVARAVGDASKTAGERLDAISSLLEMAGDAPPSAARTVPTISPAQENQLIQVRLGIAGSLFAALRAKHEPTAQHCLRVALACSAWAEKIGLSDLQRDELELASLLHDIGKIAVPDEILWKPGSLTPQQAAIMDGHWQTGLETLRVSCAMPEVLAIIAHARSWFDGTRHRQELVGEQMPLGARMLAIVDAFDAMLSDHIYRRALSLERAYHELYRHTGTQFDPQLVVLFIRLFEGEQLNMQTVARRWLQDLDPELVNSHWRRNEKPRWANSSGRGADSVFQQKLLDNMSDAAVFLDNAGRIMLWNRGAERLTGISAHSVYQQSWLPSLVKLQDEQGRIIRDEDCPVAAAIRTGVQWIRRFLVVGRSGREVSVNAHAVPVAGSDGIIQGLTLLLHDVSPEISLEQRCRSLHELATKDPLTQVANRAEFDRVHELFVAAHRESNRPCSLIMADIDRFKKINDTYGHQAGDAVIQSFARVLQNSCHPGDLVARYGGEEFVMLCADCDNTTAARRAEEIRLQLTEIRQAAVDGNSASASFGVTEIQPGDTTDTMLRRADRALMISKQTGRNRVTQLGSGGDVANKLTDAAEAGQRTAGQALIIQDLVTDSPVERTIEKLRGFIADHHGDIVTIDSQRVRIKFGGDSSFFRRDGERQIRLLMDLRFEEERTSPTADRRTTRARTKIHVEIIPHKSRDRRQSDALARARQLLISLRAYLMATELAPKVEADTDPEPSRGSGLWRFLPILGKASQAQPIDDRLR